MRAEAERQWGRLEQAAGGLTSSRATDQRLGQEETEHSEKVSKKCDRAAESTTWCHEEHKGTPDSTHAISSETHSQLAVLMHSGY